MDDGPDDGFGIGVCLSDKAVDSDLQVNDGSEHAALENHDPAKVNPFAMR